MGTSSDDEETTRLFSLDESDARERIDAQLAADPALHDDVDAIMTAMTELRRADDEVAEAAMAYMRLNRTDMRALRFLRASARHHQIVTPGMLAEHLGISTASTTKMLHRLEAAGHITKSPHERDRRATVVSITASASASVAATIGAVHARRVDVVAGLGPEERAAVIAFLRRTSEALRRP